MKSYERNKVKWFTPLQALGEAEPIEVPRCYLDGIRGEMQSVSLHGFCDASVDAYAAVVYMYLETTEGGYLKFVTAKTRVVKQSIPRLELLSALILANLVTNVKQALSGFTKVSYTVHSLLGRLRSWATSDL